MDFSPAGMSSIPKQQPWEHTTAIIPWESTLAIQYIATVSAVIMIYG